MNVVIIPPGPDILQSHVILLRDTAVIFLYHSNYSNNVYVIQAEYVQLFVWDDIVRSWNDPLFWIHKYEVSEPSPVTQMVNTDLQTLIWVTYDALSVHFSSMRCSKS